MDEWEINKPLGQCFGTGKTITENEEYFAALVETENGLQRRDFSVEYWQDKKPDVYCHWKTKMPSAEQKKNIFIGDEMLMAFFDRLSRETDQQKRVFIRNT